MRLFTGIWTSDFEQFEKEASYRLSAEESSETRYADSHLECVFLGENLVYFLGTDFKLHLIKPEEDLSQFDREEIETGYTTETFEVTRRFEYKIEDGELLMRDLDFEPSTWQLMPFRYESDKSFLIRPLAIFQRMLPTTLDALDAEDSFFGTQARQWIAEASKLGISFQAEHRIAEGLRDAPDDAVGFDPTITPDEIEIS